MANGSFYNYVHGTSSSNYFGLYCEYTYNQNIGGNYTDITIDAYIRYYSLYVSSVANSVTITVGGTSKSLTSPAISQDGGGNKTLLGSTTIRVYHNSDGTKTGVNLSVKWVAGITYSGTYYGSLSASTTVSLPTIPRSSSITSVSNITLGNKCSVTFTPTSTSYYYNINFSLGSWSVDTGLFCPGKTTAYTYNTYTIPANDTLYTLIPNSTTGTMKATLTTYSSNSTSAKIGSTSSKNFTVTVPNTVVPTVGTITLTPQTYNNLIQNKNKVKVSVSGCSAGTGSTIKSYTFSGPSLSTTITGTSATSGIISTSGTKTYKVTVTDNRGRTASKTATITCYAWSMPSITLDAYRVASSSSTTEDDNGTYVRCVYTIKYSYVNGTNTRKSFSISGGSGTSNITYNDWTKTQTTGVSGMVTETGSAIIANCSATTTYTISATVTDNYNGSATSNKITVFSAARILNIRPKGTGIAFGKIAGSDNVLDSKWPIRTDDAPKTMTNLTYKGLNPTDIDDSTINYWADLGNLATVYFNKTEQVNEQPSQYGYLLNITSGPNSTQVHQLWAEQANGSLFHRGGNTNGLYTWKKIFDTSNYTSYVTPKPTELFSSSNGNGGTVTLSASAANFNYLEIFLYKDATSGWWSVKVPNPNGKTVQVGTQYYVGSNSIGLQLIGKIITISGTTITPGTEYYMNFNSSTGAIAYIGSQTTIKIMKVNGYK
jgi:hypothetical protein